MGLFEEGAGRNVSMTYTYIPKREDVVESFATRFAAARGGSGRRAR